MYEASLPIVYGFLHLRVAGDKLLAEDLTAETFAAAAQAFREGRPETVTISWLRTVARRRLIDHWRRQRVHRERSVGNISAFESDSDPDVADRHAVLEALGRLAGNQRTALVLQHVEGYGVREVAELIGRSEKATESLLSRARSAFRSAYLEVEHG